MLYHSLWFEQYLFKLEKKMTVSISDNEKKIVEEDVNGLEHDGSIKGTATKKTTKDGILLIPQPSDDPDQPLVSLLPTLRLQSPFTFQRAGLGVKSTSRSWSSSLRPSS